MLLVVVLAAATLPGELGTTDAVQLAIAVRPGVGEAITHDAELVSAIGERAWRCAS